MNIQTLKQHQLNYRKARNQVMAKSLSTLIAELEYEQEKGKAIDASVITSKIKKYIANAEELAKLNPLDADYLVEVECLENLLPKMLSKEDLIEVFEKDKCGSIKECMLLLKSQYSGRYDGKLASSTAKEFLTKNNGAIA